MHSPAHVHRNGRKGRREETPQLPAWKKKEYARSEIYQRALAHMKERAGHFASLLERFLQNNQHVVDFEAAKKKLQKLTDEKGENASLPSSELPRMEVGHVKEMLALLQGKDADSVAKNCGKMLELSGKIIEEGEGWLKHHAQFYTIRETASALGKTAKLYLLLKEMDFDGFQAYFEELKHDKTHAAKIVAQDRKVADIANFSIPTLLALAKINAPEHWNAP